VKHYSRVKRLSKQVGARPVRDTEGVIAVLQIARRLVKDAGKDPVEALTVAADEMASPVDNARAFWAAYRALAGRGVGVEAFDEAIKAQGLVNALVKKGPR
jgi:hypothetical protein